MSEFVRSYAFPSTTLFLGFSLQGKRPILFLRDESGDELFSFQGPDAILKQSFLTLDSMLTTVQGNELGLATVLKWIEEDFSS